MLLAAHEELADHLGIKSIERKWKEIVEDQDHENPPKRVVEKLFEENHGKYQEAVDAPAILAKVDPDKLKKRCCQCFAPFVDFLQGFASA